MNTVLNSQLYQRYLINLYNSLITHKNNLVTIKNKWCRYKKIHQKTKKSNINIKYNTKVKEFKKEITTIIKDFKDDIAKINNLIAEANNFIEEGKTTEKIKNNIPKINKIITNINKLIVEVNTFIVGNDNNIAKVKFIKDNKDDRTPVTLLSQFLTMIRKMYRSLLIVLLYIPLYNIILVKYVKKLNNLLIFFSDKDPDNMPPEFNVLFNATGDLYKFFKSINLCNNDGADTDVNGKKIIKYLSENNFMLYKQLYTILKASFFTETVKIQYKNNDDAGVINENFYKAVFRYNKVRHTFENKYLTIHDVNIEDFTTSLKLSYGALATANVKQKVGFKTLNEFFKQKDKQEIIAGFLNKYNNKYINYICYYIRKTIKPLKIRYAHNGLQMHNYFHALLLQVYPHINSGEIHDVNKAFDEFITDNLYIVNRTFVNRTLFLQYSNIGTLYKKITDYYAE